MNRLNHDSIKQLERQIDEGLFLSGARPSTVKVEKTKPEVLMKEDEKKATIRKRLECYFKAPFKGLSQSKIDYLAQLVEKIVMQNSSKDFAVTAYLIYNSSHWGGQYKTFKKWLKIFCEIVGCEFVDYRPIQLRNLAEQRRSDFSMLE